MGVTGTGVRVVVGEESIVGGGGEAVQAIKKNTSAVNFIIFFINIAP